MVKFVADSSCDMLTMEGADFVTAPLTISTAEHSWLDDETINIGEMLDALAAYKGRSYTACPSVDAWLQAFGDADRIYVGTLTSGLSGTYNAAMTAKDIYLQDHPQAQIHVFDTLSTGPELRLFMEKLIELDKTGMPFEDVCKAAEEYLTHTHLFFVLRSLHNFAQNGRVNKVLAAAVGILGIRIVGVASPEGTIEPIAKVRGDKKAITEMLDQVAQLGFKKGKLRITHALNPEQAEVLRAALQEKYPEAEIVVYESRGLCAYYGERGALFLGLEAGL